MTLTGIIFIILLGLLFMLIEVLFIPGVGVVGILGAVLMGIGVYFAYQLSALTGHVSLGSTVIISVGMIVLALRSKTWDRLMLKEKITGTSDNQAPSVRKGDKGVAVTRLNPVGKARIRGHLVEVKSFSTFIDEKTELIVVDITGNQIIVKPA